jgi:transposase
MPSNSLLHFITRIVNFTGFKATNYHFITDNELLIELKNQTHQATCPRCQKKTERVHQSHRYRVRDIPLKIFLRVVKQLKDGLTKFSPTLIIELLKALLKELIKKLS